MNEEKTLKNVIDEIMSQPGNVRGEVFRTHAHFIKYKEGEEGVLMVEDKLEEFGYPIKLESAKTSDWHKEALSASVVVVAKEIFNWTEDDVYEMGNFAPKQSFIVKMFIKQFVSINDIFQKADQYWKKHYDFGGIEIGEFNEEERYITVKIKDYRFHELLCGPYFKGYLNRIAQFSIKSDKIETEQIKNVFHGDPYNEYLIRWD